MNLAFTKDSRYANYIHRLINPVRASNLLFARDAKSLIISSNISGFFNAYGASFAGGLSQLTFSKDQHLRPIAAFPRDDRILMTRDPGSCENTQLFILLPNGEEQPLQRDSDVKVSFLGFVSGSNSFYCLSNQRDPTVFDLYLVNADSLEWDLLYRNDWGFLLCAVSKDSQYLALMKINSSNDADVLLYNFQRADLMQLGSSSTQSYCRYASFDPSSTYLYYLTDANSEWTYVVEVDIRTGKNKVIEERKFGILQYRFSPAGKYKIIFYDKDGGTQVEIFDRQKNRSLKLIGDDDCSVRSITFSPDDSAVAYFSENNTEPVGLYLHEFENDRTRQIRLPTVSGQVSPATKRLSSESIVAESVNYTSFDGLSIPSFLWHPRITSKNGDKRPALIWIHGGPGGQIRKGYNSRIQLLVRAGYVVLACNYRGSFGYGRNFFEADIDKQGEEPIWDIVYAKYFLRSLPFVDEKRIGIMGSSFGGYMVLAALAFQPDEFSAGIAICGISDWICFFRTLPVHWRGLQQKSLYQKIGHPERDRDKLRRISPLFHAERISSPLLVLHGANDPRVPKIQSDRMVEAVKRNGGIVEYLVFPDEAHGLRQPANVAKAYNAILDFLDRYL
jgi:dipeptidyl aminopeptidase/acylaminoacyl peptidase